MIGWAIAHGSISVALCGARDAQQAIQNAAAGRVDLTVADLACIDAAAKRHLNSLGG